MHRTFMLACLNGAGLFVVASDLMAASTSAPPHPWMAALPAVPALSVPTSADTWPAQRSEIQRALHRRLGSLPPRPSKLAVTTRSREKREGYILESFAFDNGAGAVVPGYVFLPEGTDHRHPAILWCHWHGGQYDNGKEEMLRAEHTPEPPGPTLARRGYVVLGIDAYCFGERNGQGPGGPDEKASAGEMTAAKFHLWAGRTLWGMILRDDLLALDYLLSRPEVDPNRVGVTGMSMGATRTWWLLALDERLRAGVAVACLTRYQNLIAAQGLRYHGIYYFVPGIDTESVVAAIAPRALLCLNGDQDAGSPVDGIRQIGEKVEAVYRRLEAATQFENVIYPGVGHEYTPDMWTRMLQWMDRRLSHTEAAPKP
jgi:dienelactone hydrolase